MEKASEHQKLDFNDNVFQRLINLKIPESVVYCNNVHCTDGNHKHDITEHLSIVLDILMESGYDTIPQDSNNKNNKKKKFQEKIAGWKEFVEPLQDQAYFWHSIWRSAGKPLNTELHQVMKSTRNKYHYQIRKCRRMETMIKNSKLLENCLQNDTNLFTEIKKSRNTGSNFATKIDGKTGSDIPDVFGDVYKNLFNTVNDQENTNNIMRDINENLNNESLNEIKEIDKNIIKEALGRIKPNKSDPIYDFSSDFFKNSPDILFDHIAIILQSFLGHGFVSEVLLLSTIVPLVKDKLADMTTSKNYRSIALSSLILKILDWVIIILYGEFLQFDDFQFGYQNNSSTSLCSWVALETIYQYLQANGTVYGCFMDCTKAFDTVKHSLLFQKLLDAKIPPIIVRLIIHMYQNQSANVRWE